MAASIKISDTGSALELFENAVTLPLDNFPSQYQTSMVSIYNGTDNNLWINKAGTESPANTGLLIPTGQSLLVGPLKREDAELVLYGLGSGDIFFTWLLVFSEK
jgi:hypothetical protein